MSNSMQNITLKELASRFNKETSTALGEDFFIIDIKKNNHDLSFLNYPCKFQGYLALFCISGEIIMDINLNTYTLTEKSLAVSTPGNIIKVSKINQQEIKDHRYILVGISEEFVRDIKLDFTKLLNDSITILDMPCIKLQDEELSIALKYIELIDHIIHTKISNKEFAIADIVSSIFYVIGSIWSDQINQIDKRPRKVSNRTKMIFDRFIKLVTEHHNQHRLMSFYADKLCLTPKYLSKLVKDISGRSAPDWINSFVILEAKNMLKYSDMTIKMIVKELNFPNQSVFYKFFKSRTGLTPSEYRNS